MNILIDGNCLNGSYGRLRVAPNDKFVLSYHADSQPPLEILLTTHTLETKDHLVSVGTYPKVNVVEHLFSALYGLELFHVKIDFFSDEVPFFDGSSQIFVSNLTNIKNNGPGDTLRLDTKITVKEKNSFIQYASDEEKQLIIEMELSHPYITTQKISITIDRENYIKEIAPARTFVFMDVDDPRLKNLPSYGIGITEKGFFSALPLRFPDELVRHKILDLLGDLYVLQKRLTGKITAKNTSHYLNLKFVKKIIRVVKKRTIP